MKIQIWVVTPLKRYNESHHTAFDQQHRLQKWLVFTVTVLS